MFYLQRIPAFCSVSAIYVSAAKIVTRNPSTYVQLAYYTTKSKRWITNTYV